MYALEHTWQWVVLSTEQ